MKPNPVPHHRDELLLTLDEANSLLLATVAMRAKATPHVADFIIGKPHLLRVKGLEFSI